jgi:hypothetical protein
VSLCASCGFSLAGEEGAGLCPQHHDSLGDAWARENRLFCDFIHRKREPLRLPPSSERDLDAVRASAHCLAALA